MRWGLRELATLAADCGSAAFVAWVLLHPERLAQGQVQALLMGLMLFELLAAALAWVAGDGLARHGLNRGTATGAVLLSMVYLTAAGLAAAITGAWQVALAAAWLPAAKGLEAWSVRGGMADKARALRRLAALTAVCWLVYIVCLVYGAQRLGYMTLNARGERVVDWHNGFAAGLTALYFIVLAVARLALRPASR